MDQYYDYIPGHVFGGGVFSPNGALRGDGVERGQPQSVQGAEGQRVTFSMSEIESTQELSEALTASAEVNGRYGLFSASATFDFAKSTNMSQYSLALLLSCEVTNSFRQLRDVRLTKQARELWKSGRTDDFHITYGDRYVHGMVTGGLYYAVLQIDTSSEEEKREISASLEAGYKGLTAGFNAQAQFSQALSAVSEKRSIQVRHFQVGGKDSSIEIDADNMIARATEFPGSVRGKHSAPFKVLLKDYKTVSNLPPMPNEHDYRLAKDVVRECGRLRLRYLDWINDIDYVVSHPKQFVWKNEKKQAKDLDKMADKLREGVTGLARYASDAVDNPANAEMPTGKTTVDYDPSVLPDRKPRPQRVNHLKKHRQRARRKAKAKKSAAKPRAKKATRVKASSPRVKPRTKTALSKPAATPAGKPIPKSTAPKSKPVG